MNRILAVTDRVDAIAVRASDRAGPEAPLTAARVKGSSPKKMSAQWVALVEYLGLDGKAFSEVESFTQSAGSPMTAASIRTGLANYRKDYGLVANPKPGFYAATQKGLDFVADYRSKELSK